MVPARGADDFDGALATMTQARAGAFLVVASPLTYVQRARLAEVALKHRLPAMFGSITLGVLHLAATVA